MTVDCSGADLRPGRQGLSTTGIGTAALRSILILSFAVQGLVVLRGNINWDEFLFLSNVYAIDRQEVSGFLQLAYTHLFRWLIGSGDEIGEITTARTLYLAIWAGSLVLLYRLGREVSGPLAALAATLLFATFSYSVRHATSFRVDGLLLPVLLATALLLMKPTVPRTVAAGALFGIAVALTIKAVLWAPAYAGLLVLGLQAERERLKPVLLGAISALLVLGAIILGHHLWLSAGDGVVTPSPSRGLSHIGSRMLLEDGLFPRGHVLLRAILHNPATALLIAVGLVDTIRDLRAPAKRRTAMVLLVLALPSVSVAFYSNAWPYAYLVIIPTACLLAGRAFDFHHPLRRAVAIAALLTATLNLTQSAWSLRVDQRDLQGQVLSVVHGLFEEPVAYLDKGGMVSSFPRQPLFMSRWGMKNYREDGRPAIAEFIARSRPPFLIANTPYLEVWNEDVQRRLHPALTLLPEDADAIRRTYAHYWGPIYLAGQQWSGLHADQTVSFETVIPGAYTLIARHPVALDGRLYAPGETVTLDAGSHDLRPRGPEDDLRLLWGENTRIPDAPPSPLPIYTGL